jgi:hypothetical protein
MFKILDFTKDNLIALQVRDKAEKTDYEVLNILLENTAHSYETIRLYLEVNNSEIEPETVWKEIESYFIHFRDLNKVAIVSPDERYKTITESARHIIPGEAKYFKTSQLSLARQWINN